MKNFSKHVKAAALFSFVFVAVFTLFFYEEETIEDHLAGLMTCVVLDNCNIPTTKDSVSGLDFLGIYLKIPENNLKIKYMVGNGVVIVVLVSDELNQVTLTDIDFDGNVDLVGIIKKGDVSKPSNEDVVFWQKMYSKSLQMAWERVVPNEIKEALKNMPTEYDSPVKSSPKKIKV